MSISSICYIGFVENLDGGRGVRVSPVGSKLEEQAMEREERLGRV